jgi:biopolymer transport protein ExbD
MARGRHRRTQNELTVSVGSMGDIAFLLLIFFVLCSNFAKQPPIKVELPTGEKLAAMERVPVSVVVGAQGEIYLDGQQVANEEILESALNKLFEKLPPNTDKRILFKCDSQADQRKFLPILRSISQAGVTISALGELDKK